MKGKGKKKKRFFASTAGGVGSIPGQGTKIPNGLWCAKKKKQKERTNKQKHGTPSVPANLAAA